MERAGQAVGDAHLAGLAVDGTAGSDVDLAFRAVAGTEGPASLGIGTESGGAGGAVVGGGVGTGCAAPDSADLNAAHEIGGRGVAR